MEIQSTLDITTLKGAPNSLRSCPKRPTIAFGWAATQKTRAYFRISKSLYRESTVFGLIIYKLTFSWLRFRSKFERLQVGASSERETFPRPTSEPIVQQGLQPGTL